MSELRKDPILDRWVITLNDRFFKPAKDMRIDPACLRTTLNARFAKAMKTKRAGPYVKLNAQTV